MKKIIFFFVIITNLKSVFSQSVISKDSSIGTYKINEGEISSNLFETGYSNYKLVVSDLISYIEISTVYWKTIKVIYRLEKNSNNKSFYFTKTLLRKQDSTLISYVAIGSNVANRIVRRKRAVNDSYDDNIYKDLSSTEILILPLFLRIIRLHNLQIEYLNYEPKLFVAWLKMQ